MPVFNSSFAEYKFSKFKKRVARDQAFPKSLSLEFARSLNPNRAATAHGGVTAASADAAAVVDDAVDGKKDDDNRSEASAGAHSAQTPVQERAVRPTLVRMATASHNSLTPLMAGRESVLGRPLSQGRPTTGTVLQRAESSTSLHATTGHMPLLRPATSGGGGMLTRMPSARSLHNGAASPAPRPLSHSLMMRSSVATGAGSSGMNLHALAAAATATVEDKDYDGTNDDDFSMGDDLSRAEGRDGGKGKEVRFSGGDNVDFYRVCALCELRLPRSSMEIKVFRKHVVKLR